MMIKIIIADEIIRFLVISLSVSLPCLTVNNKREKKNTVCRIKFEFVLLKLTQEPNSFVTQYKYHKLEFHFS